VSPADWLDLVEHQQPGCSREWTTGHMLVRLYHSEDSGWQVSTVEHPDGEQSSPAGLTAQEAARHLARLDWRYQLTDVVRKPTPGRIAYAR